MCYRCTQAAQQTRTELEAEAQHWAQERRAKQAKLPRATVPYCGVCLTTLHLREVNPETGVGLCIRCRAIRQRHQQGQRSSSLAATYGMSRTRSPQDDPNQVY
jgi:hypothetical protein